ncbi:EAL domain-containing protein [Acinetobacter faecalis]|uniref:EAL domain-containing protein n=3 Tax=Acinetobacter faecalis TaxID=2665161 RepID=A0AB35V1E1_9GAMM|nr:EAL domain-containing protein [Acinetobacter faecalis]MDY6487401.1 EAL domain-containing protein [Acinetobacter faecalis]
MRTPIVTSECDQNNSSAPVALTHSIFSETNKALLNQIPNFAFILHSNNVYINEDFQQYLNLQTQNIELQDILDTIHPNDITEFKELLNTPIDDPHNIEHQLRIINNMNGEYHWFLVLAKPNLTSTNTIEWFVSLVDVEQHYQSHQNVLTKLKTQKEMSNKVKNALRISNETDELTGLLNRYGLKNNAQQFFKANNHHKYISLFLIGLDHFKNINDTQGYSAGDFILKSFAKRLKKEFNHSTLISRLGSDEFAVVYYDMQNIDDLDAIGKKILDLMHEPYDYNGKTLSSSMSIGCAVYPQDAENFSNLLQCADTALSDLKIRGRGGIQYFNENMFNVTRSKAIQIETARRIIREKSISPYYQPKVDLTTLKVIGFEALLRWKSPETQNIYTPETIAEAFDDFELSSNISAEMQNMIFADIKKWESLGKKIFPIAINASPVEFFRDNYAEKLLQRIQNANISPKHIEIEITEHFFSDRGVEYVIRALKKLQDAGIKISLDDFGTGHSSLTHLRDLPVNSIKIDYSFIEKITEQKTIAAIVEGIVKLGPVLNMNIIAEGIENEEQLEMLIKMGCSQGQGFLFKDAITAKEVENILEK